MTNNYKHKLKTFCNGIHAWTHVLRHPIDRTKWHCPNLGRRMGGAMKLHIMLTRKSTSSYSQAPASLILIIFCTHKSCCTEKTMRTARYLREDQCILRSRWWMLVNIVLILPNKGGKVWEVFGRITSVAVNPVVVVFSMMVKEPFPGLKVPCVTPCHKNRNLKEGMATNINRTTPEVQE